MFPEGPRTPAGSVGLLEFQCTAARITLSTLLKPPFSGGKPDGQEEENWSAAVEVLGLVLGSSQAAIRLVGLKTACKSLWMGEGDDTTTVVSKEPVSVPKKEV